MPRLAALPRLGDPTAPGRRAHRVQPPPLRAGRDRADPGHHRAGAARDPRRAPSPRFGCCPPCSRCSRAWGITVLLKLAPRQHRAPGQRSDLGGSSCWRQGSGPGTPARGPDDRLRRLARGADRALVQLAGRYVRHRGPADFPLCSGDPAARSGRAGGLGAPLARRAPAGPLHPRGGDRPDRGHPPGRRAACSRWRSARHGTAAAHPGGAGGPRVGCFDRACSSGWRGGGMLARKRPRPPGRDPRPRMSLGPRRPRAHRRAQADRRIGPTPSSRSSASCSWCWSPRAPASCGRPSGRVPPGWGLLVLAG